MMATLFCVVLWAQAPAGTTLFSEDFGGYAANDVPSGSVSSVEGSRVVYGGGSVTYTSADNGTNITKIYDAALASGTSPELLVGKSGGVFTVAGIPSGNAKEITVSFKQNAQKLTVSLAGNGYSTEYASPKPAAAGQITFDVTVADGADATFSIIMTAGSSNVRIDDILVTVKTAGESSGGDDPQSTTKTIYLNGGGASLWNQADAVFFVHAWGGTDVDVLMTQVEGDVYSADIPSDNTSLLFVRMAPGSVAINWDTKWNQSTDQTIPADKNLFTMTSWDNGVWSVYGDTPEPPAPVEAAYYLVGTMNSWQAAEAYKFAPAEAEGEYLLHTTLAENDEIKVIKVEGETTTWYPAEGGNYIVDALHAGEKDIYFRPAGNEAWAEFGGYIWMGENQPAPVADFTNPFTLKFNGTGESGKDASAAFTADVAAIFDAASAPYVESVETATKIYAGRPIADDNSSVKFGTTSAQGTLAFTLAQAIEVDSIIVNATQYGNNAAKVTVNGTEFDLTAGNKKPQDCKITPENAVSAITIAQSGSERIYLRNVRVYPKTQGGDTPVEIVLPVVKLAGSLTSWEEPVLMVNAEDSLSASVTLNLGIDDYQLKVVSDGNWLSKAGDGDLYTMHRDWNHVDHLDLINTGDNIKLITDVEGAYTFTWTYADSSLVVTFPEAPAQPKFYITGNEDIVGEGNPTWGKNGALESFSDTLVMNLAAGQHKFKLITPAEQWLGMEALTDTAYGLFTDDDTNICFALAEAGAVTVIYNATEFKVEGNFYVAPKVAYYLIGDSAFVVDAGATADKAWTPDAIASFKDTTVLHLKAGVNYIMRLSLEGTWENHRDFRHLTDTAVGLIELPDEFGNHSIGFSLAEAGDLIIIYIPAANEQPEVFKLIGNFYVAPAPDPTVAVMGSMNNWAEEIPFVLSDDKTYASLTVENIGADNYEFKFVINGEWRSNGYTYHRGFPGAAGITENNDANMIFQADVDGEYTFYWYFANDSAAIVYPELPFTCDWENIAWLDGSNEQIKVCKESEAVSVINVQKPSWAAEKGIYMTFPSAAWGAISLEEGSYVTEGAGLLVYLSALTQEYNEISIVCQDVEYIINVYNADNMPKPAFYLVGNFNEWTAAEAYKFALNPNNDAEYVLTATLAEKDSLKVIRVMEGEETVWYPADAENYVVDAAHAGEKDIYFRPDYQGGEDWYAQCIYVAENAPQGCDWDHIDFIGSDVPELADQFKLCKEGQYPSVINIQNSFGTEAGIYVTFPSAAFGEISMTEGTYAIQGAGMLLYCSAFTDVETEVSIVCDGNPIIFTVYNAEGSAPVVDPTVSVKGSMNDWAEEIPFVLSDDKTYASLTVENISTGNYEFKFIINGEWRSNGYRFHRGFPGAAGITENNEANMTFEADIDGEYTFYWYFANDSAAIVYPAKPEPVLANGYYLVGSMNEWTPAAENLFAQNPDNEAEYKLAINLDVNTEIKVVYVENDAIVTWFPAEGENYVIDDHHNGATTVYFRPDYQGGEDWFAGCIYVVPTSTVDITNIDANAPAVKILRDGQLLIIKGEKTFNVQGQLVK